jgi:hypothetical protein
VEDDDEHQAAEAANQARWLNEKADLHSAGLPVNACLHVHVPATRNKFLGACIDTGTTRTMIEMSQFQHICAVIGATPPLRPSERYFRCGNGVHKSLGAFDLRLPVNNAYIEIECDVVPVQNPLLIGLDAMSKLGATINVPERTWEVSGIKQELRFSDGHLWLDAPEFSSCYSREELYLLHRRLGHPRAERLISLLQKAAPREQTQSTKSELESLVKTCETCQRTRPKPFVFHAKTPDEIVFGHELIVDLFKVDGEYVLQAVDRSTGYTAAEFVSGESTTDIWNALLNIWITRYVTPNVITTDAGSAFCSK